MSPDQQPGRIASLCICSVFHVIVFLDSLHWKGAGETLRYLPVLPSACSQGFFPLEQTIVVVVLCRGEHWEVPLQHPTWSHHHLSPGPQHSSADWPPFSDPFYLCFIQQPEYALDNVWNFLAATCKAAKGPNVDFRVQWNLNVMRPLEELWMNASNEQCYQTQEWYIYLTSIYLSASCIPGTVSRS